MGLQAVSCRESSGGAQSGLAMPGAVTYSALHHSTPQPASPQSGETETIPAPQSQACRSGETTEKRTRQTSTDSWHSLQGMGWVFSKRRRVRDRFGRRV